MADKSGQRPNSRANLAPSTWRSGKMKVAIDAGPTVPTDGVGGYDPGCFFIQTDTTSAYDTGWYVNVGTAASCDFDALELVVQATEERSITISATAPTGAGYNPGALHIDTDASTYARLLMNFGTATTADYEEVQMVRCEPGQAEGQILGAGDTAATTGAGYEIGGMFWDTNATAAYNAILVNFGTETTGDFDEVQFVRCDRTEADGQILSAGDTAEITVAGNEVGALRWDTNATTGRAALLQNFGDATTADFEEVQFVKCVPTQADGQILAAGDTQPTTAAGYEMGALFWDTDATTARAAILQNFGDHTTGDFDEVQFVKLVPGEADGQILGGGDTQPTTAAGYEMGALFWDTNASGAYKSVFCNYGDETTGDFDEVQFVRVVPTNADGDLITAGDAGPTTAAGFHPGSLHFDTDGAAYARHRVNYGDATTAAFSEVQFVKLVAGQADGQILAGSDTAATTDAGFETGALFWDTNATSGHNAILANYGDETTGDFDEVQFIRVTPSTSAGDLITAGTAAPGTGAGFDKGSLRFDTDAVAYARHLVNYGDSTTADFEQIQFVRVEPGNADGQVLSASDTLPGTGAGYSIGALHWHTDPTGAWDTLHCNYGTATTADYDEVQFIRVTPDQADGDLLTAGDTAPTTGAGYHGGSLHFDTNASAWARHLVNYGDATTSDFDEVQFIRVTPTTADGDLITAGDAAGGTGAGFHPGGLRFDTDAAAHARNQINYGDATTAEFSEVQFVKCTIGEPDGQLLGAGDTAPTTAAGYDTGGLFWDTNAAGSHLAIKQNRGDETTGNFDNVHFVVDEGGEATGQSFGTGTTLPTGAGWQRGAFFAVCTDAITAESMLCVNVGSATTADFRGMIGAGATVPTDNTVGWFPGALFLDIDNANAATAWYVNDSTATTCNFDAATLTIA